MKIYQLAVLSDDMEKVYDDLKEALEQLEKNNLGKSKTEIKKAIKKLEEIRPHLKYKDRPSPSGFERKK
jgi:molecular chaperone GrpE (heat shock protein)